MAKGIPYVLSTMGTTTIEDVAATGHPNLWFQLYVTADRRLSDPLIDRAAAAGYTGAGGHHRHRGHRASCARPAQRSHHPAAAQPRARSSTSPRGRGYWIKMLRSPAIGFANFTALSPDEVKSASSTRISSLFDQTLNWADIEEIRKRWSGPLLLKGPIGPADARRASTSASTGSTSPITAAASSIAARPTIDLLAPLRAGVGPDVPIVIDSGVRHGADVAVSIALGADMAFIGRPYVYAVAAAGQRGVEHVITHAHRPAAFGDAAQRRDAPWPSCASTAPTSCTDPA